jgi:arabinofuranan 3-O-arabinosyltransferase
MTDLDLIRRYTATPGSGPRVTASSVQVQAPMDDARSAFDGDLTTPWIAGAHDQNPKLTIDFGRTVDLSRLAFHLPGQTKNLPFIGVTVSGSDGSWRSGITDSKGRFSFAPFHADRLTITFQNSPGIQIADITIPGVRPIPRPSTAPLALACGSGPTFTLGGRTVQTRLTDASPAALLKGQAVDFTSCGTTPSLSMGRQHITVPATSPFRISEAVLTPAPTPTTAPAPTPSTASATTPRATPARTASTAPAPTPSTAPARTASTTSAPTPRATPARTASTTSAAPAPTTNQAATTAGFSSGTVPFISVGAWGGQSRSATVDAPAGGYLATAENFNAGWHATLGGKPLRAVRLDGWRQAWALPVGARGVVSMSYGPDRAYVIMLLVGLAMVLLVAVAAIVPDRSSRTVLGAARPGTWWKWPVAITFGFWVGGVTGLVLVPAVCALAPRVRRAPLLVAGFVAIAGGLLALNFALLTHGWKGLPGTLTDAVPQLLCLAALGLLVSFVPAVPGPGAGARAARRTGG